MSSPNVEEEVKGRQKHKIAVTAFRLPQRDFFFFLSRLSSAFHLRSKSQKQNDSHTVKLILMRTLSELFGSVALRLGFWECTTWTSEEVSEGEGKIEKALNGTGQKKRILICV